MYYRIHNRAYNILMRAVLAGRSENMVSVLITHLDRRKEQEHPKTSFVEVIVIIKNDESKN